MMRIMILCVLLYCGSAFKPSTSRFIAKPLQMSDTVKRPSKSSSYRIFSAGSLPELLNPVSEEEAKRLGKVQDILMKAGKLI